MLARKTASTSSIATFGGILNMDTEFSASKAGLFGAGATTDIVRTVAVLEEDLPNLDIEGIRSFDLSSGSAETYVVFPQYTRRNTANKTIEFVVSGAAADGEHVTASFFVGPDNLNDRGDFEDAFPAAGSGNVSTQQIPEINVQLRSDTVAAKTRKLKAQWTPEFAQDLNAYHSIDAEAELTSMLSEYISMEIDLEILDMLIKNADTVEGWSATVAKDVTVSSNNTAGGGTNPTFTSTIN